MGDPQVTMDVNTSRHGHPWFGWCFWGTPWNGNLHFLELFHKSTCRGLSLRCEMNLKSEGMDTCLVPKWHVKTNVYRKMSLFWAPLLLFYWARSEACTIAGIWMANERVNIEWIWIALKIMRFYPVFKIYESAKPYDAYAQVTFLFSRVSYICYPWRSTWDCFARPRKTYKERYNVGTVKINPVGFIGFSPVSHIFLGIAWAPPSVVPCCCLYRIAYHKHP